MLIAMSTSDFLPNLGGVAAVVSELSKALARRGHEVHVVHWCFSRDGLATEEEVEGVKVRRVFLSPSHGAWQRLTWAVAVSRALRGLFAARTPDVIHSHSFYPDGLAARFYPRRSSKVFTNHTSGFIEGFHSPVRRRELGWILRGFDCVLAPSAELAELTRRCGVKDVRFISNGVDPRRFTLDGVSQKACRRQLNIPADAKVILVARRFEVKNGVRFIAAAFKKIRAAFPDALLIFCGPDYDGIELPAVKEVLAQNGGEQGVRFEGAVENDKMPVYYRAADVSVLPSLMEATSVSGLEAMASGLALVGTEVGGIPYIIEHGKTGVLVPPSNSEALSSAVIGYLLDAAKREEAGRAARELARRKFSWDAIAAQTEEAYEAARRG